MSNPNESEASPTPPNNGAGGGRRPSACSRLVEWLRSAPGPSDLKPWKALWFAEAVERLLKDKARLDWLADPENQIGNVQLPVGAVEENLHSLRAAIDAAMTGDYARNAPLVEPGYSENVTAMASPPETPTDSDNEKA